MAMLWALAMLGYKPKDQDLDTLVRLQLMCLRLELPRLDVVICHRRLAA
jgi:hypothetical protein